MQLPTHRHQCEKLFIRSCNKNLLVWVINAQSYICTCALAVEILRQNIATSLRRE